MIKDIGLETVGRWTAAAVILGGLAAQPAMAQERKSYPAPEGHPLTEIISGYEFRNAETQALQDDDFENPAFLWVDQGEELWSKAEGTAGKACADCHGEASESMKTVGARYPVWEPKTEKPINVELRINQCRTERMGAEAWKYESSQMVGMTAFVKTQSRGEPVNVDFSEGDMEAWKEKGKEIYYTPYGQLDLACSNCHEDHYGEYVRSDFLSQGQTNGFPTYRLKWQGMGTLHRRFSGCMKNIRAEPYKRGSDEFLALEVYLAYRGVGLPVESPALRN
ncbi:sulfur oxidation c-type cytochrome SoxA [Hwanghaeella sp.]|uniref:sulfur oxidation c-type cytochrome SoxA n=1 Tax=Hwanghaeella sp. TaxID=2605943 RepID=UPI003CCBB40F